MKVEMGEWVNAEASSRAVWWLLQLSYPAYQRYSCQTPGMHGIPELWASGFFGSLEPAARTNIALYILGMDLNVARLETYVMLDLKE
ncbi:hypothetical protein FRB93_010559 [Tulasnella sp. JGI-2019a]|nr:hypothetical protein FRB93_010559 [Tulasnella sp. JGI-2019a]